MSGTEDLTKLQFHPIADMFPLMEGEEFDALVADIKAHGLRESIKLYQGKIIDGRNRYRACLAAGWGANDFKGYDRCVSVRNGSEFDPVAHVISANIHRRHLSAGQKRDLIAKLIKARPEKSNNSIAKQVKADDKTVAKVRRDLEATSEIPKLEKTVGADGKARKAKKPKGIVATSKARARATAAKRKAAERGNQSRDEEAAEKAEIMALVTDLVKAGLAERVHRMLDGVLHLDFEEVLKDAVEVRKLAAAAEASADAMKAKFAEMDEAAATKPDSAAPKKRGRPPGSRNKPKPVPAPTASDEGPVLGNDPGPIPECLRRAI